MSSKFTSREFAERGEPQATGRSHRLLWILGALTVVAVLVIVPGVVLMVGGNDSDQPAHEQDTSTAAVDLGELSWEQVGRTELPVSSVAGPRQLDGVTAKGFAHTRAGAIMAAMQIPVRLAVIDGGTDDIYNTQVLGSAQEIDDLREGMRQVLNSYSADQTVPRIIAWRENVYQDQAAAFDFAMPGESSSEVRLMRNSVVWFRGDWKYQPGLFGQAKSGPVDADSVNPGNGWHRFEDQ